MHQWYIKRFIQYCRDGDIDKVKYSMNLMTRIQKNYCHAGTSLWRKALEAACSGAHIDIALFLESNCTFTEDDYVKALGSACESGSIEMFDLILTQDGCRKAFNRQVLMRASKSRSLVAVNHMYKKLLSITKEYNRQSLVMYILRGSIKYDCEEIFTAYEDYLKLEDAYNYISEACWGGNLRIFERILKRCDVSEFTLHTTVITNSLENAATRGHLDILKRLVELAPERYNARINKILNLACNNNHLNVINYVLSTGGKYTIPLLRYAFESGNLPVRVDAITDSPKEICAHIERMSDEIGLSAAFLRYAFKHLPLELLEIHSVYGAHCRHGNIETVQVCFEYGMARADIFNNGLYYALSNEHLHIAKLIIDKVGMPTKMNKYLCRTIYIYMPWLMDIGVKADTFK